MTWVTGGYPLTGQGNSPEPPIGMYILSFHRSLSTRGVTREHVKQKVTITIPNVQYTMG